MDIIILITIASALLVLIIFATKFKRRNSTDDAAQVRPQPQARAQAVQNRAAPRRVAAVRNTRARLSAAVRQENSDNEDEPLEEVEDDIEFPDGKLGAKKRAKIEAKADRLKQREAEERMREDKKRRQELADEERDRLSEKEKLEEAKRLAEEKKVLEEKERQEHEEYLKMKEMFSVEEEGCEVAEDDEQRNLLQEFVNYIKSMKVVVLEDLAAHFKLKTQNVIDRIHDLQAEGTLTGVLDDRGKFIFISQEELNAVAKFVKQRGRVSISDLAESSNQLINLNSSVNASVA